MPQYCCVPGCTNRRTTNFHLFKFPLKRESSFLEQWTCIVGKDFHPTKYDVICSAHFTQNDFMIRPNKSGVRLKYNAIPLKVKADDLLLSTTSNESSSRSGITSEEDTRELSIEETCTSESLYTDEELYVLQEEQPVTEVTDISHLRLIKKRKMMSASNIHIKLQDLTPRERQMQREIRTLKQKLCRKEKKITSLKKLLEGLRTHYGTNHLA